MTSFKRWLGAGAIVLVALALVACPALVPKATGSIPDMPFAHGDTKAQTVDLGRYFDDSDNAKFSVESSVPEVVTAVVNNKDATLTVTPKGPGTTIVTVTATSSTGRDSAEQSFTVKVAGQPPQPPPPENNPPVIRTINNVSLDVGKSKTFDLADYASDADGDKLMYEAESLNQAVAMVSVNEPMITIMGVSEGETMITVRVTDGKGDPVPRTFIVTVTAPAPGNMKPQAKSGMTLDDLKIQIVSGDDLDTANDWSAADTADNVEIDLSEYFEDPDGVQLFFKVETKNEMATDKAPVIQLHSIAADEMTETPASGKAPDGTNDDETMVIIVPRNPGSVEVMVTVYDVDKGDEEFSFKVEVHAAGSNSAPTEAAGAPDLANLTGDAFDAPDTMRMKVDEMRKIIDADDFDEHFTDPDFNTGDSLKISVKYFSADTDAIAAAKSDTQELADDKVGVTANRLTWDWDGNPDDEFTLTLTGKKGTVNSDDPEESGHVVALVATDSFGESVARVFRIMVNNPPKAMGAQASKPKTLGTEMSYGDLGFFHTDSDTDSDTDGDNVRVVLVADDAGYFHDPDGDELKCRINDSSDDSIAKFRLDAAQQTLTIDPEGVGSASVTIACVDPFMEGSDNSDTLNVEVTHQSRSQQ